MYLDVGCIEEPGAHACVDIAGVIEPQSGVGKLAEHLYCSNSDHLHRSL